VSGTTITESDIELIQVDRKQLPAAAPRKRSQVLGHEVTATITKGEFILTTKVSPDAKVQHNSVPLVYSQMKGCEERSVPLTA